jgi:hypothetical protein
MRVKGHVKGWKVVRDVIWISLFALDFELMIESH